MSWLSSLIEKVKRVVRKVITAIERFANDAPKYTKRARAKVDNFVDSFNASLTAASTNRDKKDETSESDFVRKVKKVATIVIEVTLCIVLVVEVVSAILSKTDEKTQSSAPAFALTV